MELIFAQYLFKFYDMSKDIDSQQPSEKQQYIYGITGLKKFLGTSYKTACKLKKELPHYQRGRTILFKKEEVLNAMAINHQPTEL